MAIVEISIVPVGTKTASVSRYIARAVNILEGASGIRYETTAMGTIIEGDLDRIFALIRKMHETVFDGEVMRAVTTIKIDDRRDKPLTIEGKLASIDRAKRRIEKEER